MQRKIHMTVMLAQEQLESLDRLSTELGKSKSQLIGEALSIYLRPKEKPNSLRKEREMS